MFSVPTVTGSKGGVRGYLDRAARRAAAAAIRGRVLIAKGEPVLGIGQDPIEGDVSTPCNSRAPYASLERCCDAEDGAVGRCSVVPLEAEGRVPAEDPWQIICDDAVLLAVGLRLIDKLVEVDDIRGCWTSCRTTGLSVIAMSSL